MRTVDRLIFCATFVLLLSISAIDGARNPILFLFFSSAFLGLVALWLVFCYRSYGAHFATGRTFLVLTFFVLWLLLTWFQSKALIGFDSIDRYSSEITFYLYAGYCAAFILLIALLRTPTRILWIAGAITGVGVLQTIFGMTNFFSGETVFGWAPTHYAFSRVTGSYINRNFYANLVVMAMGFPFVWMIVRSHEPKLSTRPPHRRQGVVYVCVAILFIILFSGLLLSGSRAAFASFIGTCLVVIFLVLVNKRLSVRRISVFSVGLLSLAIAGVGMLNQRFSQIQFDASDRIEQWKVTLDLVAGSIFTGYGAGTYESAFRTRSAGDLSPMTYSHAHNDYLELVIEQGVFGLLIVSLAVVFVLWTSLCKLYRSRSQTRKKLILSGMFGIFAICLHAVVDSPFQVPANTWYFVTLLSIAFASSEISFGDNNANVKQTGVL